MTNPVALVETYRECLPIIHVAARRHYRMFGGQRDESESKASLIFVTAYMEYDYSTNVPFEAFLKDRLRKRLISEERTRIRREKLLTRTEDDPDTIPEEPKGGFDFAEFIASLTEDGRTAVKMAFKMKSTSGREIRTFVRNKLRSMGWTHNRINTTFLEIRSKL